jgi:hypothetical protein
MTLTKSVLTFAVSSIFILFLYLTINSYTLGNTLQRENFRGFISSQLTGDLAPSNCQDICDSQANPETCSNYCSYLEPMMQPPCLESCQDNSHNLLVKQMCVQSCLSKANQSQEQISNAIDAVYNKEIISGVTINQVASVFSNSLLLLLITIISAVSLFFVAERPVSKIGSSVIWVSLSVLLVALIPVVILKPDESVLRMISDYLFASLYQQMIIGVALLAIGIVLMLVGKKIKK